MTRHQPAKIPEMNPRVVDRPMSTSMAPSVAQRTLEISPCRVCHLRQTRRSGIRSHWSRRRWQCPESWSLQICSTAVTTPAAETGIEVKANPPNSKPAADSPPMRNRFNPGHLRSTTGPGERSSVRRRASPGSGQRTFGAMADATSMRDRRRGQPRCRPDHATARR